MIQSTLILVKPDGVQRGLVGEVVSRFERVGLKLIGLKMQQANYLMAEKHYLLSEIGAKYGREVWDRLISFLESGPVVAMVFYGDESISVARKICGATEPTQALPGTIRGDFCHHSIELAKDKDEAVHNVVHASSSQEDAIREIGVWFNGYNEEYSDLFYQYRRMDEHCHTL